MSIQQFKDTADQLHDTLADFVKANVRSTGDKAHDCQQIAIMIALHELNTVLSGTRAEDLILPDGNHEKLFIPLDRAMAEATIEAVNIGTASSRVSDAVSYTHLTLPTIYSV